MRTAALHMLACQASQEVQGPHAAEGLQDLPRGLWPAPTVLVEEVTLGL